MPTREYIAYSPDPGVDFTTLHFTSGAFNLPVIMNKISESILSLGTFLKTRSWTYVSQVSSYGTVGYQHLPYFASESDYWLFRPFPLYNSDNTKCIGYYDPRQPDAPPQQPGITIYWFPALGSELACLYDVVAKVPLLYPNFIGEAIIGGPSYNYGIKLIGNNDEDILYNNIAINVNPALGIGGTTTHGGLRYRSALYRDNYFEMSFADESGNLHINTYIQNEQILSIMGKYIYYIIVGPYQYVMLPQDFTGSAGDGATWANSLVVSMPYILTNLTDTIDFCAVQYGATHPLGGGGYAYGSITDSLLFSNYASVFINSNNRLSYRDGSFPASTGIQFPVFRCGYDLYTENIVGEDDTLLRSPAYLSLPSDLTQIQSKGRIVGYLWDTIMVSKYYEKNTKMLLDNEEYLRISAMPSSYLGNTPSSLFLRMRGN